MITLYRVDERLIHGQTMIKLLPSYPCDAIIIVDDKIAKNNQMKMVYQSVLPTNVKLYVFDTQKALRKLPEAEISKKKYYVITKEISEYEKLLEGGYRVNRPITVSCANKKEGSVSINSGFALLPEEIGVYNRLDDAGYNFEILTLISRVPQSWKTFRTQIKKEG